MSISKKLFLTTSKQNESIVHILALFSKVTCLCSLSSSGFSSIFLYIAFNTLSLISDAAAFVNVTTNNLSISMFSLIILFIILSTNTAVFPLPAAAATSILLSFSYIACFCSSVHFTSFAMVTSCILYRFHFAFFMHFVPVLFCTFVISYLYFFYNVLFIQFRI